MRIWINALNFWFIALAFTLIDLSKGSQPEEAHLQILHFNDVYNIEERKAIKDGSPISAGASRFVTEFKNRGMNEKLVVFSGDLFSPSALSTHLKGE